MPLSFHFFHHLIVFDKLTAEEIIKFKSWGGLGRNKRVKTPDFDIYSLCAKTRIQKFMETGFQAISYFVLEETQQKKFNLAVPLTGYR